MANMSVYRSLSDLYSFANARHNYAFPRVSGMIGDGKTSYDFGSDGEDQVLGGCSVSIKPASNVTLTTIS